MASRHFSRRLDGRKRDRDGAIRHKRGATLPMSSSIDDRRQFPSEIIAGTRLSEILDKNDIAGLHQLLK
jgi:hypothetical protein